METTQSIEIIESMFKESKKSLHRNSFYFIIWGLLLVPAGIAEYLLFENENFWMIWPAVGILGGIISTGSNYIGFNDFWKLNSISGTWTQLGVYPPGNVYAGVAFVILELVSIQISKEFSANTLFDSLPQ